MFNVAKARTDKQGNLQRPKYKGVAPVSLGYGCYLGETCDDNGNFKAFFLMTSFVAGTSEFITPSEIRASPRNADIPLDNFPFSKKFGISDDLCESLVAGEEYWFLYTAEPVSKPIEGKMVTYEALDLIFVASDVPGFPGIYTILPLLKFPVSEPPLRQAQ
jgi:hypothetical protein